ncbi:diadenylate cyclase CdaA [Candidatus Desulfovibrio trichonymphae]|uniref:Diadenylate cyclase n=1 Tax=Candidatus Desulfovibrio trichonymphae TaxID=1725232 RepID=A0A1J1E2X6_9BACT|nr:diadenylate cyclase CdaA [Candidatus Desulfovibrio trichonymphae]BAV92235.1 putative cyclic-di-AMP synthase [Candidatus Desulfovibrio trichonymphae]GHU95114.1 membrane protein [Deltaproteobacteria bacterium]GHU99294.1 membrane protein [Deltaproteobacteria bacterium]
MFDSLVFGWRDLFDIALVSALLYQVIQLVRGSRAFAVLTGLGLLTLLYFMSSSLGLYTLTWLLQHVFGSLFILIVVIFQGDIRQALGEIGMHRLFKRHELQQGGIEEVVMACQEMARLRVGALIVIERSMRLGDMIEREGVRVDAQLSRRLLMNIFHPKAPLHDGAVIISAGRIMAAACILPLAVAKGQSFGTRHRAALGITKESDAAAVVVSEERGEISLAIRGELLLTQDATRLRQKLNDIF